MPHSLEAAINGLILALREPDPLPAASDRKRIRSLVGRVTDHLDALDARPAEPPPTPIPAAPRVLPPLSLADVRAALDEAYERAHDAAGLPTRIRLTRVAFHFGEVTLARHGRAYSARDAGYPTFERLVGAAGGYGLNSIIPDDVTVLRLPARLTLPAGKAVLAAGITRSVLRDAKQAYRACVRSHGTPVPLGMLVKAFAETPSGRKRINSTRRKLLAGTSLFTWDASGENNAPVSPRRRQRSR